MKSALVSDVDRLLVSQAAEWPALARGLQGLRESEMRAERVSGREMLVRHIPHRIKSTTAAVDSNSIAQRPCFLCPANLDPEQKGIPFSAFTIYCNPFPILDRHLTIVHVEHRPQRIEGQIGALLNLAEALDDSFVIYNGPACGASAPDHLHFQACSRAIFPIEQDRIDSNYIPRVFVLRDGDAARLSVRFEALTEVLREVTRSASEPMINVAALFDHGLFTVLAFPRGKHRPRVYETRELTVSPATIDLCGVFVVPMKKDFDRIRGADIEKILEEVTLPADAFETVLSRIGATP